MTKSRKLYCVARKIDRDGTFAAAQFDTESYGVMAHHWRVLYVVGIRLLRCLVHYKCVLSISVHVSFRT